MSILAHEDPALAQAIRDEAQRQREGFEMIASENFVPHAVLEAQGSVLTNKYAEGYPGKRYYGGCEFVDIAENLAIERAKELFGAAYANVQPHSGASASAAVLHALAQPGDTILGLELAHGGHLTHGMKLNSSGQLYNFIHYGVSPRDHRIDFDGVARLAAEHRPKLIVAGASAYPREIPHDRFAEIAQDVGAKLMVDMAHYAGLVAAGLHHNPVGVADYVTTTTHKTLRGPRGGLILCSAADEKLLNRSVFPGMQGGPLMHVIAGKAVCFREALTPEFIQYQTQVIANAKVLAEALQSGGLQIISGGTDNHLLLVDVTPLGIGGKIAEATLDHCGITVNMNMIPFDQRRPMDPSGIRIGTPALTTRGMGSDEMRTLADWILAALKHHDNPAKLQTIRQDVINLASQFPVPADRVPLSTH